MSKKVNAAQQTNGLAKNGKDSEEFLKLTEQLENVQNEFNKLKEEHEIHQTDAQGKKLEILEKENKDLLCKVSLVEGRQTVINIVFTAISLIFVLVSISGFLKIYQLDNFKDARIGTNKLLINLLEQKSADLLNKFNITGSSDQEAKEVKELKDFVDILENLEAENENFKDLKYLIDTLRLVVLENNLDEAKKKIEQGISYQPNKFVLSRLYTLSVVIPISQDRNKQRDKERLKEAIKLDPTNALAFNNLAILQANEARDSIINKDTNIELTVEPAKYNEVNELFRESASNFEVSASINQSAIGQWKCLNNKVWINLIRLRYIINTDDAERSKIDGFLNDTKYQSVEQFFKEIKRPIEQYETETMFPNPPETLAQIYWLEAEYKRKTNKLSEKQLKELENIGREKFKKALSRQLYKRAVSTERSVEQFKGDYLHKYIEKQRPEIFDELIDMIENNPIG